MTDTNHTDRSNLGQIEKKFDPLSTETQHTDSVEALAKELRMVANMINMGEKIQWGHETTLMDKAADMLTTLHTPKDTNPTDSIHSEKEGYQHTDSVEAIVNNYATPLIMDMSWINHPNYGEHLKQAMRQALTTLQAHTSQQVEEAVLQADATGAYHSGYLAGKAEVEEAVRIDENTSDGYHTFRELYEFRLLYNAHLFNEWAKQGMYDVHKSQRHNDGELCFGRDDYFVVVATLPTGQISNHYPMTDWDLFQCEAVEKAKAQWDGHTSQDVAQRLRDAPTPNHQD